MSLEGENASDFDRQNTIGKPINSTPAMEENDVTHEKMMELVPLLEASGERNLRSINFTHVECPCHCLAQMVDGVVSGALEPLLDMGPGGSSVNRVTRSSTEGHPPSSKFNAGVPMDRGEYDEISGVEGTDSGIDTRY